LGLGGKNRARDDDGASVTGVGDGVGVVVAAVMLILIVFDGGVGDSGGVEGGGVGGDDDEFVSYDFQEKSLGN
jgi:hypothetical protein